MRDRMHIAPIGSESAGAIHALQHRLFPRELTESLAEITTILRNAEEHLVCNLSFGLFDGMVMVGYVFAFVEERSVFHDREEEIVYVKECAVLPGYEGYLRLLLSKLYLQRAYFVPELAVEAHSQAEALANWRRLDRWFRHFGIRLSATKEIKSEGMPPYARLRFDVNPAGNPYDTPSPLPDGGRNSILVIESPGQWLGLRKRWQHLLEGTDDAVPTQSFHFLWYWWRYFGIWNELRLVLFFEGAELSGAAPLMVSHERAHGRVWRKFSLLGVLDGTAGPSLIIGSDSSRYIRPLLDWLEGEDWDVLEIARQPDGEMLDQLRETILDRHWLLDESHEFIDSVETSDLENGRDDAVSTGARASVEGRADAGLPPIDSGRVGAVLDRCWDLHESGRALSAPESLFTGKEAYFFFSSLACPDASDVALEARTIQTARRSEATALGFTQNGVHQVTAVQYRRRRREPDPLPGLLRGMATSLSAAGCERMEARTGLLDRVPGCRVRRSAVRTLRVYRSDSRDTRSRRRRGRMRERIDGFIEDSGLLQACRKLAWVAKMAARKPGDR